MKFLILALVMSGCAFQKQAEWDDIKNSTSFKMEKETYRKNLGGKEICMKESVHDFLSTKNSTPRKECLYFGTPIYAQNNVAERLGLLKVAQVIDDGFIVESEYRSQYPGYPDKAVYIIKTVEADLVDGAKFDDTFWDLYEYLGTFTFKTVLGASRTIYSFKKIARNASSIAAQGLQIYSPVREIYSELGLWDAWEKFSQSKSAH